MKCLLKKPKIYEKKKTKTKTNQVNNGTTFTPRKICFHK